MSARFADPAALSAPEGSRSTICVASAVGARFHRTEIGLTVFGNDSKAIAVDAWGLNDVVGNRIAASLSGKADVKQLSIPASGIGTGPREFLSDPEQRLLTALAPLAAANSCTSLIYVSEFTGRYGNTNVGMEGVGIAQGPIFGLTLLHAFFDMRYYAGQPLQMKTKKTGLSSDGQLPGFQTAAQKNVDAALWVAAEQIPGDARIRMAARELIEEALNVTLPKLIALR